MKSVSVPKQLQDSQMKKILGEQTQHVIFTCKKTQRDKSVTSYTVCALVQMRPFPALSHPVRLLVSNETEMSEMLIICTIK